MSQRGLDLRSIMSQTDAENHVNTSQFIYLSSADFEPDLFGQLLVRTLYAHIAGLWA